MPRSIDSLLNIALMGQLGQCQPRKRGLDAVLQTGITLQPEASSIMSGEVNSPAGRLLEITTKVEKAGPWFALRITLPPCDFSNLLGLGFWLRSSAASPTLSRACLRIGTDAGYTDHTFDQHILSQSAQGDHHALMMFDKCPTAKQPATWREFILFLPPAQDLNLSLIDMRLFTIGDAA